MGFTFNHSPVKRMHSPSEYDLLTSDHARKKYISEQFAKEIAAMSLGDNGSRPHSRQQQHSHPYFRAYPVTLQEPTASSDSDTEDARPFSSDSVASAEHPRIAGNNNGLRIDVVKTTLVGTRIHDTILPLEKKPGVSKLSIPDFILRPFSSTSTPDTIRYHDLIWRPATAEEEREVNREIDSEEEDDSLDEYILDGGYSMETDLDEVNDKPIVWSPDNAMDID